LAFVDKKLGEGQKLLFLKMSFELVILKMEKNIVEKINKFKNKKTS
jgi:hypothetical protein